MVISWFGWDLNRKRLAKSIIPPGSRLAREAADARPHDRQRLADALSLNPLDLESRRGDGRFRAAREMAIAHQVLPDRLDAALPFQPPGPSVRCDMLEKQQAPARLEHAGDRSERRRLVRHRAQDERTDHRIELPRLERQRVERRIAE